MTFQVLLKYYDTNGHNFGVETSIPNRSPVRKVYIKLPEDTVGNMLKALQAYRKPSRPTLRSRRIDDWLRAHALPGNVFTASLDISDSGEEHRYFNIKKQ